MRNPHDYALTLLQLADRDVRAFLALKNDVEWNVDPHTICFHAQQGVEKSLKAVLVSRNLEVGRTHDLNKLFYQIEELSISFPISLEELSKLNPYAVTVRYDDLEVDTITVNEAEKMLAKVFEWAKAVIGSE
jgi:HEPN domain-containing protein